MPSEHAYTAGDNWLAIAAAAIAIYAVGFVIYGGFSKVWIGLTGYTKERLAPHRWKMSISPIMPILTAIGIALILKMDHVTNIAHGVWDALEVWFFIILPVRLYSYVYGPEKPGILLMDGIHLLLGTLIAGAIIAGWR